MDDIKTILTMWGNWARCSTGTEMSRINVSFKNLINDSTSSSLRIDDQQGMLVDSAVVRLKKFDELAYNLVIYHYVYRISQSKLAKQIGKAQSYVTGILRIAEAFIAGQMADHILAN
jgi:hypothetical protein